LAHLVRNAVLLNFWLLGWPVSFLLLRRGLKINAGLTRAALAFITIMVLANAFYWHPGQVATGPLRLHETIAFLLLLSGLAWHRAAASRSFLSRYVPIAIATAHMGFVPVREGVLTSFIHTVHEPRLALSYLDLDASAVLLSGEGNLFHYPVNDPWLRTNDHPVFMWDGAIAEDSPFWNRPRFWLTEQCDTTYCTWSLTATPPQ